jgi:hypothetical protein
MDDRTVDLRYRLKREDTRPNDNWEKRDEAYFRIAYANDALLN